MVKTFFVRSKIYVANSFSEEFNIAAREMNGRFDYSSNCWVFMRVDWDILRERLLNIFGEDGIIESKHVTVDLDLDEYMKEGESYEGIEMFGFSLAKRIDRDYKVKLDRSVYVKAGEFPNSGGSGKYPSLDPEDGTVLRIKNVPIDVYEKQIQKGTVGLTLVEEEIKDKTFIDLLEERKKLQERIAVVETKIKQLDPKTIKVLKRSEVEDNN